MRQLGAMDERDIAVEEWKQLQTIIGRFDTLEFQIRGWLLVLLGILVTTLFTEKAQFHSGAFCIIGIFIVVAFCSMELMTRRPKRIAINRAHDVEDAIRQNEQFDSPRIADSISEGPKSTIRDLVAEFTIAHVWAFYLLLFFLILVVSMIRR
jgi:hypothetical protein